MKSLSKILFIILMLTGLTACNDEPKSKLDEASPPKPGITKVSKQAPKQEIHETFLQGKISGNFNGKAFIHESPKSRDSMIRATGNNKSLILSFGVERYVAVIITRGYHGKGTYQDEMSLSPFLLVTKPKAKFKTLEKTLSITEDNKTKLVGTFSFKVASASNENFTVDGSFEYEKIIIDNNDEMSLLKELKITPALMKSLGKKNADKDFVIKAIKQNGLAFYYADDQLKKDRKFILRILKEGPKGVVASIKMANKEAFKDKEFALKMLAINPFVVHALDKKLRTDKDIINAAKAK